MVRETEKYTLLQEKSQNKRNHHDPLCIYRKFTLDAPGFKVTNHDFSHLVTIRDFLLENYIYKLKFPKITTYRVYNTKYLLPKSYVNLRYIS